MRENTNEIGERLRKWGLAQYASVNGFAEALGVGQASLSQYLNGRRIPGNDMQSRLRELGCDVEWIMTGTSSQGKTKEGQLPATLEDLAMLRKLKSMGIDSLDKLESFCDPKNIAADIAYMLRERLGKYGKKKK